jgi:hypothetical protein
MYVWNTREKRKEKESRCSYNFKNSSTPGSSALIFFLLGFGKIRGRPLEMADNRNRSALLVIDMQVLFSPKYFSNSNSLLYIYTLFIYL